jgi:uncharacterized protein YbbC (DUF1343 family)
MNGRGLPGVYFRPVVFEPTFQKHTKQACGGCQIHVLDRGRFEPVRTAVEMIEESRAQDPATFGWRQPPYEYEHEKMPIDILYGSRLLRDAVEGGSARSLVDSMKHDEEAFRKTREKYLLY